MPGTEGRETAEHQAPNAEERCEAIESVTRYSTLGTRHFALRAFERREVRDAVAWAQAGNIALHFFRWSHPHFGTGEYCHILSADRERLIAFGAGLGFVPMLLQKPRRGRGVWHYDAWGWRTLVLRRLARELTTPNA